MKEPAASNRIITIALLLSILGSRSVSGTRVDEYLSMRTLVGEGRFREAIQQCQRLIDCYPDYASLYESLAEVSAYAGELQHTRQYFLGRIDFGEALPLAYFGLGEVLYFQSDFEESFRALEKAIELGESSPECFRMLVYAYSKYAGVNESAHRFTALCHRFPQNANYWYAMALALYLENHWSRARTSIEQAIRLDRNQCEFMELAASIAGKTSGMPSVQTDYARLVERALRRADFQSYFFLKASEAYMLGDRIGENKTLSQIGEVCEKAKQYGYLKWYSWALNKMGDHLAYTCNYDSAFRSFTLAEQVARIARDGEEQSRSLLSQTD